MFSTLCSDGINSSHCSAVAFLHWNSYHRWTEALLYLSESEPTSGHYFSKTVTHNIVWDYFCARLKERLCYSVLNIYSNGDKEKDWERERGGGIMPGCRWAHCWNRDFHISMSVCPMPRHRAGKQEGRGKGELTLRDALTNKHGVKYIQPTWGKCGL